MLTKIAWIKSIWFNGYESLCNKLLIIAKRLHGGFLSSSIAIECKDNFTTECIIIHQQAAQDTTMVGAKCSTARCNCCGNTSQVCCHDICVTFNDYCLALLCNLFFCNIKTV